MFALDFSSLPDDGSTTAKEQPRPRAAAKVKAKAKVRAKQGVAVEGGDYLMQLQIAEKERAAAALAMMKSQMANAPPQQPRPAVVVQQATQRSMTIPAAATAQSLPQKQAPLMRAACTSSLAPDRDSSPEVVSVAPPNQLRPLRSEISRAPELDMDTVQESIEMKQAREDDEIRRAAEEAAVLRSIEHDRRSGWWKRLKEPVRDAPIERCGVLPLHAGSTSASSSSTVQSRLHNPLNLPVQEFSVECEVVTIRAEPSTLAPVCGARRRSDRVRLIEESFDGWAKLAEEPGWILRTSANAVAESASSVTVHLAARGPSMLLASPRPSSSHERLMFEVLCEAGVDLFREPHCAALRIGTRSCGEFLLADTQSYHGWVRLSDNEGWAQARTEAGASHLQPIRPDELQLATAKEPDDSLGPCSPCDRQVSSPREREVMQQVKAEEAARQREEAARQDALRLLGHAARMGVSSAEFCAAVEVARDKGVAKRDIARCNALRNSR